jgi:co-chaperonin GroES (HSP10)
MKKFKSKVKAIGDKVLVSDMDFGEQKTKGGLIISSDDGQTRGVHARWGKVFDKGPRNKDDYEIGHWVLIEHGRWTRGVDFETHEFTGTVRMVENSAILGYSDTKPDDVMFGNEYNDGDHMTVDPSSFIK